MGFNFTSTKPSFTLVSFLRQTGYVASPDCLRTFGLLGALSSFSMVHFASPLPVLVAVQPGGAWPALASSKLTVSASAEPAMSVLINRRFLNVFIMSFVRSFNLCVVQTLKSSVFPHHLMLPEDLLSWRLGYS